MADGEPPVPQTPPMAPTPPVPSVQPVAPPVPPDPMPLLNWCHFKPEFPGKPDEDVEAHLLEASDLMETHAFSEGVKVQKFCLTLEGETRLWY